MGHRGWFGTASYVYHRSMHMLYLVPGVTQHTAEITDGRDHSVAEITDAALRPLTTVVVLMCASERGRNPVEPLPEGWVSVTHMSGMPVYLHRQSRVVTITRPYFLGPGSLRVSTPPNCRMQWSPVAGRGKFPACAGGALIPFCSKSTKRRYLYEKR